MNKKKTILQHIEEKILYTWLENSKKTYYFYPTEINKLKEYCFGKQKLVVLGIIIKKEKGKNSINWKNLLGDTELEISDVFDMHILNDINIKNKLDLALSKFHLMN